MPFAIAKPLEALRSLFFPTHCAGCARRVEDGSDWCEGCAAAIERVKPPRCEVCSQPYDGVTSEFTCPNCRGEEFSFLCAVTVARSQRTMREVLHRLKYNREMWLARVLAEIQAEGFKDSRFEGVAFDALIPVPLHPRRLRERQFNQAAILAEHLSRSSKIPVRDLLNRTRYTGTQTRLNRKARRQNLRDAFSLRQNADVTDLDLLLVDDVLTTGSTLDACAAILLENGARSVRALTVARG
ncbi:MAG: ComF family protein [Terrimicrobiaceae bacterium]